MDSTDTPAPPRKKKTLQPQTIRGSELCLKALSELLTGTNLSTANRATEDALKLMRAAPGCIIRIPRMEIVERLAREFEIVKRVRRDASPASTQHTADFHGMKPREIAVAVRKRNNGVGIQVERARRSATPGLLCRVPRFNRLRRAITV